MTVNTIPTAAQARTVVSIKTGGAAEAETLEARMARDRIIRTKTIRIKAADRAMTGSITTITDTAVQDGLPEEGCTSPAPTE